MTCFKCVEAEHLVVNGECAACDVVITGTSGSVTIFYTLGTSINTITANVGDTVYIPKSAIDVSYITNSGDAEPDTSCLVIGKSDFACYQFAWEIGSLGEPPLDDSEFVTVYVGTTEFNISAPYATYFGGIGPNVSAEPLADAINAIGSPLITSVCYRDDGLNSFIIVRSVGTDVPKIKIHNPTGLGDDYLYLYGELLESCDCPEDYSVPDSVPVSTTTTTTAAPTTTTTTTIGI